MVRNIVSVISGFVVWTVLWLGSSWAVRLAMPEPFGDDGSVDSTGILVAFIVLSFVFSIIAGFTTATLTRRDRMKPSLALGIVLLVVGIFAEGMSWAVLPLWYHLFLLALLIPGVLIGARMRLSRS